MKPWIRVPYYCTNVAGGCGLAKADQPFSNDDYRRYHGRCAGEHGCGAELKPGAAVDLRPRWASWGIAGLLLAGLLAWVLRAALFPPPLQHVDFAVRESESSDDAGLVRIEVVRSADLAQGARIDYAAIDGSAKAGQDYTAERGRLLFAPGEGRKLLTVTLLPDTSFQKHRRSFSLVLLNVLGEPSHLVTIGPRAVARSDAMTAERSVRAASLVAKDLADAAVRQRILGQLLAAARGREGEFAEYRRALVAVDGNLIRARESYLQLLRELQSQQPSTVLSAMDSVAGDLERKTFVQQAQAVIVMKRQFTELLRHASPDMDRWVKELSAIVPQAGDGARRGGAST